MFIPQRITVLRTDRPPDVDDLGIRNRMHVDFNNGMTLLGYSLEREHLTPGDFSRLALFWRAKKGLNDQYSVSLRLLDEAGEVAF